MFNKIKFKIIDWYMKTTVVDVYEKCKEEQWFDQSKLEEIQYFRLKSLLVHAYNNTKYFNNLFKKIGFDPLKFSAFEQIKIIPIQTKKVINANFKSLISSDFNSYYPRITRTSGSTGEPLTIYHSGLSHTYLRAINFVAWNQVGYEIGDRYATFSGGALLPNSLDLKQLIYAYLLNSMRLPSYHLDKKLFLNYIKKLKKKKIPYIYGYSSVLYEFAKVVSRLGYDFSFVKGIFSSSDMLYKNQREFIEKVFGIKIIDIYGNPESGLISYECEKHNGFHYGMQNCYVEIVDEEGNHLECGKIGRIIVTSLNNYCFPIIRYDTGDIGSLSNESCSCGRGLKLIKNLEGRDRDFIILPDGQHIHGAFFNHLQSIYQADWLDRYHIKQISQDKLIFQCLVNRDVKKSEIDIIKKEIEIGLGNKINVIVEIVDTLPLTQTGKYKLISREFSK